MRIRWETYERTGQSVTAMAGRRRVGQVVRYDTPPGWTAWLHDFEVTGGPWSSVEAAQAAFEVAWTQRGGRRGRPGYTRRTGAQDD